MLKNRLWIQTILGLAHLLKFSITGTVTFKKCLVFGINYTKSLWQSFQKIEIRFCSNKFKLNYFSTEFL